MQSDRRLSEILLVLLVICGLFMPGLIASVSANDPDSQILEADQLFKDKKYTDAVVLYEEVLTRNPSFVNAYPGLIKCYAALGDLEGGVAFIESLYLEEPDNAGINYGMGYALYRQKEYDSAAGFFDRAVKLDPDLAEAWNNRAVIYHFVEHDYQKARQYYEKAIVLGDKGNDQRVADIARKNLAHLPKEEKIVPITEALTLENFLNRFIALVEEGDKTKLQGLVMGQKDNSIKAMDWLIEQAEKSRIKGDKKSETTAVTLGKILAGQYAICFESDVLSTKLEKY